MRRAAVAVALLGLAATSPAAAQSDTPAAPLAPVAPPVAPSEAMPFHRGALEVWGGVAQASPQWGQLGEAPDVRLGLVALRWTRALGAPPPGELPALEWTIDLIPFARISPSLISLRGTGQVCATATLCVLRSPIDSRTSLFPPGSPIGFGISPLGVTRRYNRETGLSPFVGLTGGVLWFDRPVPTTQAATFNFTASAEFGVRLGPPNEPGITLSYRFHHLSNAGTAGENPGVASHVISIGLHRPRLGRGQDRE